MKMNSLLSIGAAVCLTVTASFAAGPNTYQVTGPVLAATDSMITVEKGKERFEIARDASSKVTGDVKVGSKVTIIYTMTATSIEVKPDKAAPTTKAAPAAKAVSPAKP